MTTRTRTAAALSALALTAVVAPPGCGNSAASDSAASEPRTDAATAAPAAELIVSAARRAQDAPSLTMRTTTTVGESTSEITTRSNADASRVSVLADVPGMGQLEARGVDGTFYLRLPAVPGQPGDVEWVSLAPGDSGGPFAGAMDQLVDQDPRLPFDALTDLSSAVTEVERSEVEGVPVTQYRLTVDVAALAGPDAPSVMDGSADLDVWVDDEGFIRRFRYELDGETIDMPAASVVIDSTVLSYDDPVDVEAPPADATVPFAELFGGG